MFARLSAFVIWALVAATVVFWVLSLVVHPLEVPSQALAVGQAGGTRGDLTRLLGSAPVVATATVSVPEAGSRFRLIGVMATKARGVATDGENGLALIAVDGKPARAFAVGSSLDSGLVLRSVGMRSAIVSQQGAQSVTLELPPLAEPATGRPVPVGALPSSGGINRSQPGSVPANIATLPVLPTLQNPAMAGQPSPAPMPMARQPMPVQDTAAPPPARSDAATPQ